MLKPLPIENVHNVPMITLQSRLEVPFESVFTSNWLLPDGRKSQLIINYLPEKQIIRVDASSCKNIRIHHVSGDIDGNKVAPGKIEIEMEPLSAKMISYQWMNYFIRTKSLISYTK